MTSGLKNRPGDLVVCGWGESDPQYAHYHDTEWGVPVTNDLGLYEKMCLEGFQAGLSWLTILRKRENFREAFAGFQMEAVAQFNETDVRKLLQNSGIIRHRGKIEATISNARAAIATIEQFGSLARFFWSYEPNGYEGIRDLSAMRAKTPESEAMSKALKKLGWRFVGPTTCYSLMQADGIVNDHLHGCFRQAEIEVERQAIRKRT